MKLRVLTLFLVLACAGLLGMSAKAQFSNAESMAETYITNAGITSLAAKQYVSNWANFFEANNLLTNVVDFAFYAQGLNTDSGTNLACLSSTNSYLIPPAVRSWGGIQLNQSSVQTVFPDFGSNVCIVVWYQQNLTNSAEAMICSLSTTNSYPTPPFEILQGVGGSELSGWFFDGTTPQFVSPGPTIGGTPNFSLASIYAGSDSNSVSTYWYDENHILQSATLSSNAEISASGLNLFTLGANWRGLATNDFAGAIGGWIAFNTNVTSAQIAQIFQQVPVVELFNVGDSEGVTSGSLTTLLNGDASNRAAGYLEAQNWAISGTRLVQGTASAMYVLTNSVVPEVTGMGLNAQTKILSVFSGVNDVSETAPGVDLTQFYTDWTNVLLTARSLGFKTVAWTVRETSNTVANPYFSAINTAIRSNPEMYDYLVDVDQYFFNLLGTNYYTNTTYTLSDQTHFTTLGLTLVAQLFNQQVFPELLPDVNPQLTIIPYGDNFILTWPVNPGGFTLESTTSLVSPVVWSAVSPGPITIGSENVVFTPVAGAQQFYRLIQ